MDVHTDPMIDLIMKVIHLNNLFHDEIKYDVHVIVLMDFHKKVVVLVTVMYKYQIDRFRMYDYFVYVVVNMKIMIMIHN